MVSDSSPDLTSELFAQLACLEEPVLTEVVREAEQMVEAQFSAVFAADQRALSLAGVAITLAGALLGVLFAGKIPALPVPAWLFIAILAAAVVALIGAAILAVLAALPSKFHFPGNEPENWDPRHWVLQPKAKHTLHAARVEQAIVLQAKIASNRRIATRQATLTRRAIHLGFGAVGGSVTLFLLAFLAGAVWG